MISSIKIESSSGIYQLACSVRLATNCKDWAILVPGTFSSRDSKLYLAIANVCPINFLAFDPHCTGDSSGAKEDWKLGDYQVTAREDIEGVIRYIKSIGGYAKVLIGHSRGANEVLMHSILYDSVPFVISLAARFNMKYGLEMFIKSRDIVALQDGSIGSAPVRLCPDGISRSITLRDLEEREKLDYTLLKNLKNTRFVWFVHGSKDRIIDPKDCECIASNCSAPNTCVALCGVGHSFKDAKPDIVKPKQDDGTSPTSNEGSCSDRFTCLQLQNFLKDSVFPMVISNGY